jgi:hypothetical protein
MFVIMSYQQSVSSSSSQATQVPRSSSLNPFPTSPQIFTCKKYPLFSGYLTTLSSTSMCHRVICKGGKTDVHDVMTHGGQQIQHSNREVALDAAEWSTTWPGRCLLKRPQYPLGLCGSHSWSQYPLIIRLGLGGSHSRSEHSEKR